MNWQQIEETAKKIKAEPYGETGWRVFANFLRNNEGKSIKELKKLWFSQFEKQLPPPRERLGYSTI